MFTRYEISPDAAFGGWLMPVVPPMVSAANGALLIPYAGSSQGRLTLLLACYAMFGIFSRSVRDHDTACIVSAHTTSSPY